MLRQCLHAVWNNQRWPCSVIFCVKDTIAPNQKASVLLVRLWKTEAKSTLRKYETFLTVQYEQSEN